MRRAFATLVLLCLAGTAPASPLTLRCSAKRTWGDQTIAVHIDMALPDKATKYMVVSDRDGREVALPDATPVGVGKIEITEVLGEAKQSHRHDFIVTRMPDDRNSLVGFYLVNSYVNSIRADLWQKDKDFLYLDTYNNEILRGTCR